MLKGRAKEKVREGKRDEEGEEKGEAKTLVSAHCFTFRRLQNPGMVRRQSGARNSVLFFHKFERTTSFCVIVYLIPRDISRELNWYFFWKTRSSILKECWCPSWKQFNVPLQQQEIKFSVTTKENMKDAVWITSYISIPAFKYKVKQAQNTMHFANRNTYIFSVFMYPTRLNMWLLHPIGHWF